VREVETDFGKILSSRMSRVETFTRNQVMFRECDKAECIYYVLKGSVELFLANTTLETMGESSVIGNEGGFMDKTYAVSSRCVSESCTVLSIPIEMGKQIFNVPNLRAEIKRLSMVPLFRGATRVHLARFLRFAQIQHFLPNHVVVSQGKRMSSILIVKSGQGILSKVFDKNSSINISTLGFGSVLNGDTVMRRSERCQVKVSSKSGLVIWSIRCDLMNDRFLGRNGTLSVLRKQIRSKTTWR